MSFFIFNYENHADSFLEDGKEKQDFGKKFATDRGMFADKHHWLAGLGKGPDNFLSYGDDHIVVELFDDSTQQWEAFTSHYQEAEIQHVIVSPEDRDAPPADKVDDVAQVVLSIVGQKFDFISFGVNRFEDDHKELDFVMMPLSQEVQFSVEIEAEDTMEVINLVIDDWRNNDSDIEFGFGAANSFTVLEVTAPVVTASVAFEVAELDVEATNQEAAKFSLANSSTSKTATLSVLQQGDIGIEPSSAFEGVAELQISIGYDLSHANGSLFKVSVEINFVDIPVARGTAVYNADNDPILFDFLTQFGDNGYIEFAIDWGSALEIIDESGKSSKGTDDHLGNEGVGIQGQFSGAGSISDDLSALIDAPIHPSEV